MTMRMMKDDEFDGDDYIKVKEINNLLSMIIEIEKSMNRRLEVDVNAGEYIITLEDVKNDLILRKKIDDPWWHFEGRFVNRQNSYWDED